MSVAETLGIQLPKLPELDQDDVKAIRSFLPGKLLGRMAALLSLALLVLGFAGAVDLGLKQLLNVDLSPTPWLHYVLLFGLPLLVVTVQSLVEWRAAQRRRALQVLAVRVDPEQAGYFRIGPYLNTTEDRAKFRRADKAHEKVLDWIDRSVGVPLYLTGDSGSGKSSLLNAFVLPTLRERGWTVVEARAWQDPMAALCDVLARLASASRGQGGPEELRDLIEGVARQASGGLLLVLDQFEEFVILGKLEQQQEFATLLAGLRSAPIYGVKLLLVLRSDYQTFLEDLGLPLPRQGDNLYQVARFTLATARAFMARSGLDLQPDAIDRLLTSAAELDETPGLVRPITLNVIGYVLAAAPAAPSLDAGRLVHHYIEQTVGRPAIRDFMPPVLEQMITEQSTKQPRSEQELAAAARLRPGEVRAALNGLGDAGLARTLDPAQGIWELSHDFVARAVARYLGRRRRDIVRQVGAYAAPALLAVTLLTVGGVIAWDRVGPYELKSELADLGLSVSSEKNGLAVERNAQFTPKSFAEAGPLLARLTAFIRVHSLDLSGTKVESLEPLRGLTALVSLDLNKTKVESLEPLRGLTALVSLDLNETKVESLEPLRASPRSSPSTYLSRHALRT